MGAASSYLPWFNLQVEHRFFSNNLCRTLAFRPTPETEAVFAKAGLLTRNTSGGVQVFYDESRHDVLLSLAANPDEPLKLKFLASSHDPWFGNYTQPFPFGAGSVLYFDNQPGTAGTLGRVRLHQEEFVGAADFVQLTDPSLEGLLGSREGVCGPPLVASIGFSQEDVRALNSPPAATATTYYISFQAGQTLWKYYLLGDLARAGCYVNDREERVEFISEGEVSLADRMVALSFRSRSFLPFLERSDFHFQLRDRNSGGGRVLIRRLPVASPRQTNTEIIDGEKTLVSEMFINR